ncbi:hypothetical protein AB833_25800 [Chromatiales bacterium (ex Bugula neritina AB1)]|nr:hypothetical protein AB833_25800 [Chromatiales bacterium (ex Bugula neritina AB1)]
MVRLKVKCICINPYLEEQPNSSLVEGQFEGKMISLTLNKIYNATAEGGYFRVIDNTDEDYLYPQCMFEIVDE